LSRVFNALRTSYKHLNDDSKKLEPSTTPIGHERRAIYDAIRLSDGHQLIVKLVERYGEEGYRLLASQGLALELHYCGPVDLGLYMIVMDKIEGGDCSR
jgi:hypothetical protein